MDKQNWKSTFGSVWTVPISESFRGGPVRGEKSKGAEREHYGKPKERSTVEVEGAVAQVARRHRVDDKHTLYDELKLTILLFTL